MDMNTLIQIKKDGTEEVVTSFRGIEIAFKGHGNLVKVHETFVAKKQLRLVVGSKCNVLISEGANCGSSYIDINAESIHLSIGKFVCLNNVEIFAAGEPNLSITLGDNTIFAIGVIIRANDRYTIYERKTRTVINKPKFGIEIGSHVWIGQEVFIMKDVKIPDGCIVGARSVVTSSTTLQQDSVIVGCPARSVKQDVAWDIKTVDEFEHEALYKTSIKIGDMKSNLQINKDDLSRVPVKCSADQFIQNIKDNGPQNRLDLVVDDVTFETLYIPHEKQSRKLFVFLSAGGRNKPDTQFQAWSWCRVLDGNLLCVEDPTYKKLLGVDSSRTLTGWYFGDKEKSYLNLLSRFIDNLRKQLGFTNVIFSGTSAGGYAALYLADAVNGTSAIVANPQIRLSAWHQYPLYKEIHSLENIDKFGRFDLSRISMNRESKFIIFSNTGHVDSEQISYINGGKPILEGGGISTIGNVTILLAKSQYKPNHLVIYSQHNFMLFSILNDYPCIEKDVHANYIAKNIIHQISAEFDRKFENEFYKLFKLISNKCIEYEFSDMQVNMVGDHINIYFKDKGAKYRYDAFVESFVTNNVIFGFHANVDVLEPDLRRRLLEVADKLNLNVSETKIVFKIYSEEQGFERATDKILSFINETRPVIYPCLN